MSEYFYTMFEIVNDPKLNNDKIDDLIKANDDLLQHIKQLSMRHNHQTGGVGNDYEFDDKDYASIKDKLSEILIKLEKHNKDSATKLDQTKISTDMFSDFIDTAAKMSEFLGYLVKITKEENQERLDTLRERIENTHALLQKY